MKSIAIFSTLAVLASANPHHGQGDWMPPGHDDFRGPCPMMNTLANHGFLPRDGRNITRQNAIAGLNAGLNFNESLGSLMFDMAIKANPEPNATFFTLDHLNRHNVLEHDASLSRTDAYFGSNHIFNQTIFDESRAYWTEPVLTPAMLANSKIARQVESKAFNPEYVFTRETEDFSIGEVSAPIVAFGSFEDGSVDRDLVEYFFQNERLPTELGWTRKEAVVNIEDILKASKFIRDAASLFTDADSESGHGSKRDCTPALTYKFSSQKLARNGTRLVDTLFTTCNGQGYCGHI